MKHINQFIQEKLVINKELIINEKLVINKNTKIEIPKIDSDDDLKSALEYLITTLDDKQYNEYCKVLKNTFGVTQLWYTNLDELFDALQGENIGHVALAVTDLITILKYNQPEFVGTPMWKKFNTDQKFNNQIDKFCKKIAQNM